MMAMIMAKRNQMKKTGAGSNNNKPQPKPFIKQNNLSEQKKRRKKR